MLSELKTFSPISISWKPVTSRVGNLIVPTFPSSNDVIEIFFDWHPIETQIPQIAHPHLYKSGFNSSHVFPAVKKWLCSTSSTNTQTWAGS